MAKYADTIDLMKTPIEHDGLVSMKLFYREFHDDAEKLYGTDAEKSARHMVSLCRAAVGGLAAEGRFEDIRSVVSSYNTFSGVVLDVCDFESCADFGILNSPESDILDLTEMLSGLCRKPEPVPTIRRKYPKSPYPSGNLEGISKIYRDRYGINWAA
jgi:hypothetical protein